MPLLYGEGDRAFLRLQEEIIRKLDDDSILAWGLEPGMHHPLGLIPDTVKTGMSGAVLFSNILASSPNDFVNCGDLSYAAESAYPFTLKNTGLQIRLPLVPVFEKDGYTAPDDDHGWIGLLSCSTRSTREFLGILLSSGGRGNHPRARLTRAEIRTFGSSYNTVVVGARTAARAVVASVTITGFHESQTTRGFNRYYRQILINESSTILSLGCHFKSGTAWNIAKRSGLVYIANSIWDSKTMIHTIAGDAACQDIMEFSFEQLSSRQAPKFTVFIRTVSRGAIVREGDTFSENDRRAFYNSLEHNIAQYDTGNLLIHGDQGRIFDISVAIRET
ncbi:hypothetical protein G6011_11820 [Alternaria panax]|uniref:DUF8212 domain-containing protein n=1 Tax=Alternaria panax TaxID=48097 RepID=A0AAD4F7X7_9PLEO|nr:hypothetical protein G6011_11820 [Alternaria panax]